MRRYLDVLATARVTSLLASSILARLPLSVNSLATVLYLQRQTGSFAVAGAAAGGAALGIGAGGVVQSRLVDRIGRGLILPAAVLHAALLGLLVLGGAQRWPAGVLVAVATAAGLAVPPTSALLRTVYPTLFSTAPMKLATAYAIDAIIIDFTWIVGPLLVAGIVAVSSAGVALGVSAAAGIVGTVAFLATAAGLPGGPVRATGGGGALRSPGIVTLTLATFPLGFAFGALEVVLPAFAHSEGQVGAAGVLLAILAASSIAGTLVFGARPGSTPLLSVHLALGLAMPLAVTAIAVASSTPVMALIVVAPGLLIGPLVASRNELTGRVALPGTETEAYTWPIAAIFTGTGAGAAVAGGLIDASGWRAAVFVAAVVTLAGTLVATARRATLSPRAPSVPQHACSR